MRKESEEYQVKVEEGIKRGFEIFHVPSSKIHYLKQRTITERVIEVVDIISQ